MEWIRGWWSIKAAEHVATFTDKSRAHEIVGLYPWALRWRIRRPPQG